MKKRKKREVEVDRLGRPLAPAVKRFRKQFKDAPPVERLETADDMLAMFFRKVAQSEAWTRQLLKEGF